MRRTDVQFKTADDQAMPVHDDVDVLDDVQPDVYEGIADAYCGACTRRWSDDETRAWCDVVAEEVEAGRAEVGRSAWRHGRFDRSPAPGQVVTLVEPPPLTAADVRAIADVPEGSSRWTFASRLEHIVLWAGDLRLHPHDVSRDSMSWWGERGEEVARRLRDRGWPLGESEHLDVAVVVDAEHRVRCATDQPARSD